MRKKYILSFLLLANVFISPLFCQDDGDTLIVAYKAEIEKHRKGKNIKFMYSDSSPLTPEQKKQFKGLNYFPVDYKYKIEAKLVKYPEQDTIIMKTLTDRAPEYIRYGEVLFTIDTFHLKLTVFQNKKLLDLNKNEKHLFVPFKDDTSNEESYSGGRYIDCEIPEGNTLVLDFNKAYNPYCAYNPKYSCVIPPDENSLPLKLMAGEKTLED